MSGRDGNRSVRGIPLWDPPPHFAHTINRRSEDVEITVRRAPAASSAGPCLSPMHISRYKVQVGGRPLRSDAQHIRARA